MHAGTRSEEEQTKKAARPQGKRCRDLLDNDRKE
jgi:hypothetical protein